MGRGRAKAKQAKVARQLKYNIPDMDLDSLQRELAHKNEADRSSSVYDDDSYDYDAYADWDDSEDDSR